MVQSFVDFQTAVSGEKWDEGFNIFKQWLYQCHVDGETEAKQVPSSGRRTIFLAHMKNQRLASEQEEARACLQRIVDDTTIQSDVNDILSNWKRQQKDKGMRPEEALQMPFISVPNRRPSEQRKRKASHDYMSRNTNESRRQPLKLAQSFEVHLKPWDTFRGFVDNAQIPPLADDSPSLLIAARMMLGNSLLGYHAARVGTGAKESQQLGDLENILKPLLQCFGFEMDAKSDPADDFVFDIISPRRTVLVGEGKDAKKLPTKVPLGMSHELCRFGLGTWLVTEYTPDPSNLTKKLEQRLKLTKSVAKSDDAKGVKKKKQPPALNEKDCSEIAKQLINDSDKEFHDVVKNIHENLRGGKIKPADANSLWGAVMQACLATLTKQCKYTLALSMVNMWFIKLCTTAAGQCHLLISDPVAVGSPGSNLTLFKFLHESAEHGSMTHDESRLWEKALNGVIRGTRRKPPSVSEPPRASGGGQQQQAQEGSSGGQQNNAKRKPDGGDKQQGDSQQHASSKRNHAVDVKSKPTRSAGSCDTGQVGELVTEPPLEEYIGSNEFGIVPFFHQIKDVVEDLGFGRCGTVKKIKWKNDFAALKEYMLNAEEDGRCFFEVFEHERKVLLDLQPLWGKYVPELLFHKPWPCKPLLGLQLGTPMPSDWSDWSTGEQKQADDAITAVEEHGWIHGDVKGNNFVRLTDRDGKTSIALIDFENAYPKPFCKR